MKRKLALLLAMVMVFVSVPFTGFAETQPAEEMAFAEFLPEAAAVEEAVAQEAAEAVDAEAADAITDVEESELALAGEGQDGGQQSGGSGIEFEWDQRKKEYSIGVLNNNEVSINRILDNLQIDRETEGCSVADAEIRQSGFYLLDKSLGQNIGEWKVNCGSGEPSNGILWVKLQNSSEFEINMRPSSSGGGQQGGPGYDGPRGIYWTGRELHAELDGWDYGNSSWITDNDGNQPVKVEYDNERDLYDIQINVKPELWNRVYNNTDLSRGVRVRLYFESPDSSVVGYRCDYRGGTEQGNDMMNSVLSLDPILFSNQHSSVQENAPAVNVMKEMLSSADEAVLVPIREEGLLGYAWFTEVSPKKQAYVFEGEGENVKNFELAHFKITHVNEQDVAVKNESVLSENYLFTDSDRTYTEAGVLFGTNYQSGRLTYTLDADAVEAKDGKVGFFREKPVVTKISVPGATEISAEAVGETATLTVVSGADPNSELLLKAEIADGNGGWNFGNNRRSAYRISYKMGERTFSKLLTIEITKRYNGIVYDKVEFRPVSDDRIIFDQSLTDSDKGFYLDKNGHGEIVTKWSGKSVNMDRVNRQITVSVPTDITGIKGYRVWTAEGNIGLREGNEQEAIEIRDSRLKNMGLRTDIPENDQVSMRAFYLPQEFMVDGKRVYSLAGRSPAVNENSICFIDWVYEEGGQVKDCFEYYYWTTEAGHTDITMPESIHSGSGSSEPMLYQVVLNGVTKNKDDYFLRVKYYGRSGNGYDYYKIDLADKDGHVLNLKNGNAKVTVKFTYPDGTSKEKLTNINTFLTHFEDETYSVKNQEQIRFEEGGIYVDLDHFSPFMLTWEEECDHPWAGDMELNGGGLSKEFFVEGPAYNEATGVVNVTLNRRTIDNPPMTSEYGFDYVALYHIPDDFEEIRVNGGWDERNRVAVCAVQLKDGDPAYEELKKTGYYERKTTVNAKKNGVPVSVAFTVKMQLKDVDVPAPDRFLPEKKDDILNSRAADGQIAYEVRMSDVPEGETFETGLYAPQEMTGIASFRVNDQQEAGSLKTDGNGRKYASVATAVPKALEGEKTERYTVSWFDSEGRKILESVFRVVIKPAETGEQVLMTPFKDGDFSFRIIGWPDNEKDPFTVEYKNNAYYIHMNMTQEDWQKAYDNRPAGEYNLRLKMYLKAVPYKAAAYAVMSSGNMLDQKREEEVVNTLTGGGSEYFPAEGEMFRNSDLLFADYTEGNDAATVAPRPNKNGMMKSLAWKDANGFQMNVGAPGTISHVKYALVYIDFADPRPVSVKTSGYKADGRDILPNYNKVAGKYFLEGKPVELDGNCVRYYLDGDALTADRQAGEDTPKTIVTGFRAPKGAVAYEVIGDNLERSGGKHNLPSDRVAPFELGFYVYSIESYEDVFSADFQILWHMNDGSAIRSGNLSVYAAVARKVNTLDENGWNRIEASRITLPEIFSENPGVAIEKEAGHLHTKFTGDPLNEEIYEDKNSMFRITVPKFGGAKPAYFEMTAWEGADLFGSFRYSIDEVIGFGEKNPVGDSDWIGFRYEGLPEKRELIENGTTYLIYQGREFGVNKNCTAQLYVRWYDADKKTLGTEWLYITADPCCKEYTTKGTGQILQKVDRPIVLNASMDLHVKEYITDTEIKHGAKREAKYYVIAPVDEKGFEIVTGAADVMLPYPDGMNRQKAVKQNVTVYHYNDDSAMTKGAEVTLTYEDEGIRMHTESFSPFLLTWEESAEAPEIVEPEETPVETKDVPKSKDNEAAINEIAGNTSVDTKKSAEEVQAAVKDIVQAVVNAAGQGLDEKDIKSVQIRVETVLKAVEAEDGQVSSVKYTVEPIARVDRKNGKEAINVKLENESLSGDPITIRLAVPGNVIGDHAKVQHRHAKGGTDVFIVPILGTNPNRYVEFTVTNFSEFELDFVDACTVTWKNEDGTILQEGPVEKGTMPVYEGVTPTKTATAYYRYEFAGWVPEVKAVTEDALYIAQFRSIAIYDDGGSSYSYSSSSGKKNTAAVTYSAFWQQGADGSWIVKDRSGKTVTAAWLCDDAVKANGKKIWYLLGADGAMITAGLVQDASGNYFSLETAHTGYYGMMRYQNGTYDGIYMEFSQKNDGTFGAITNQSAIDALKAKYGVTKVGFGNETCTYTSTF